MYICVLLFLNKPDKCKLNSREEGSVLLICFPEIYRITMPIKTFVFFDLETTGLPNAERNCTKITELCFIAVGRYDIFETKYGAMPPCQKLSLMFNPERDIQPVAERMTGLSREYLNNCPTFEQKVETILYFLEDLEKPVCLVAHNGNSFDFKMLLTEFNNARRSLPPNLMCIDSLQAFRRILKENPVDYRSLNTSVDVVDDAILTDDDDEEFPALNISNEDWSEIDNLSTSFSGITFGGNANASGDISQRAHRGKVQKKSSHLTDSYTLTTIYKRLLNKEVVNAHRAEVDCIMLLECVIALKDRFINWSDACCKKINTFKPFVPF